MRSSTVTALLALVGAGIAMMACQQAAPPATTPDGPAQGPATDEPPPSEPTTPTPTPTPQPAEMSWPIGADAFGAAGDADLWLQTSNRSQPFRWDRITGDAGEKVRVSIGGKALPFTSTMADPAFADDISGATWTVSAEVSAGEVVLVLTAEDLSGDGDTVEYVTITNPGSGYTSAPSVTFSAPPPGSGGIAATGTTTRSGRVASVTLDAAGSGYASAPTVSLSAPPSGGTTATGAVTGISHVASVTVTNAGLDYTAVPTVTFSGGGGSGATATVPGLKVGAVNRFPLNGGYGTGYTSIPTVTIGSAPSGGTTATATAFGPDRVERTTQVAAGSGYSSDLPGGFVSVTFSAPPVGGTRATGQARRYSASAGSGISRVDIDDRGSGYTSAPTITFGGGGSGASYTAVLYSNVQGFTITNAGSGYTSWATVTISGGGGSGAAGQTRMAVQGVTVTNGGSGYTSPPTVTFSDVPVPNRLSGHGAPSWARATGTAALGYTVSSVTVTNPGSGYTAAPTVTIGAAPSGGTDAAGTAVMTYGAGPVTLTNVGSGYVTAPTVTITGGGGSGATATATLAEGGYDQIENLLWARQTLADKELLVEVVPGG